LPEFLQIVIRDADLGCTECAVVGRLSHRHFIAS